MTPEEKVNNDFWWILREIRNEELLTTKGKSVEFCVRVQPKTSAKKKATDDTNPIPSEDTQRKLLYKLKEWKALNLEPAHDMLSDNMFNPPTRYFLTIHQEKFNELYRSYESSMGHQENKETQPAATPQGKPTIRLKTLELIAQKIGNLDSGSNLVNFLKNCGVDDGLIVYPNTKWRMVFDVLVYLASSSKKEDKETLSKVIGEATHPLMHEGNEGSALVLRKQFDEYLKYDNMGIAYDKDTGTYWALRNADDDETEIQTQIESDDLIKHLEEQSEKQLEFLSKPESKEKISLLRKAYQLLTNVVFFFCEDPARPTVELNQSFQYLYKLVNITVNELGLSQADTSSFSRNEHFFYLPFSNLFSAEKVYKEQGQDLSWQKIRPEMNAMYGDIEEIYQEVSGSDVLAEPDKQDKLNKILLSLSVLKKKREIARKVVLGRRNKVQPTIPTTTKIEITRIPELQIKGLTELAGAKKERNGSKFPHKLPAGTKWEDFTIKFLDDENVFIQIKQFKHNASYKEMGFIGRGNNPNPSEAWIFLKVLARVNGELTLKDAEAKDKYKKQKEFLAKSLQGYFSLDYDPFYPYRSSSEKNGNSYKIKITLIPPPTDSKDHDTEENKDDLGLKEYLNEQAPQVNEGE